MDLVKCPKCNGAKKSWGLGMIYGDCSACKAVGYVEIKKELVEVKKGRRSKEAKQDIEEIKIIPSYANQDTQKDGEL